MGALDFLKEFENRAIDAATYKLLERNFQMQEDNNRLLKEKAELLQEENLKLRAQNDSLRSQLETVREKVANATEAAEYVNKDGIAFRRKSDGSFEETPFCPNCHSVMGSTTRLVYNCPKCGHVQKVQILPGVVARQLSSQHRDKASRR